AGVRRVSLRGGGDVEPSARDLGDEVEFEQVARAPSGSRVRALAGLGLGRGQTRIALAINLAIVLAIELAISVATALTIIPGRGVGPGCADRTHRIRRGTGPYSAARHQRGGDADRPQPDTDRPQRRAH